MANSLDNDLLKATVSLLEKKSPTTIFIFDRSEFYMCFGDDAKFVTSKIFHSDAFLKQLQHGQKSISFITVNKNQFQKIIQDLLLIHQYRVELYRTQNKKPVWDLVAKASPGNFQDFEHLFAETGDLENAGVAALKLVTSDTGNKNIALAWCDKMNQKFIVSEFPDNAHFSSLQALLVQFAPKEFLVPTNERSVEYKAIEPILRRFGAVTYKKEGDFSSSDVITDLNRLLKFPEGVQPNAFALAETKLTGAMSCVAALIGYLKLLSDTSTFGRYALANATFDQFVRIDANVVRALDLFELSGDTTNPRMGYGSKTTLYGLLNRCRTGPGKRLLDRWIKTPLVDVNKINERLDVVESFVSGDGEISQALANILSRFPDIQRISNTFLKKRATLLDLYKFYQAAILIGHVIDNLGRLSVRKKSVTHYLIEPLEEVRVELKKLVELVTTTLDLENMKNFEIFIKPSYDAKLADLKNRMNAVEEKLENEASRASKMLGLEMGKSLKFESNAQFGYFLRITNKDEKILRKRRDITIVDSIKNGVKFHTSEFGELNEKYKAMKSKYEENQESIVVEVLAIAASYLEPMQRLCAIMARLDVLLSFSVISRAAYVRPEVLEKEAGILELRDARHPCLEIDGNVSFIPNDVCFEKDNAEFLLITGPNMGGKSTYLRQTGLIVLMAQIGCFVPCSSARLSVVDAIFTRVGASDAQLEGASTFRMEMIEMAAILQAATRHSLILIDELGRGTSTYDGCALARAIAEHIATNIRGRCMFATHFHELTSLDISLPNVRNVHTTADISSSDGRFTLLYRVKPGPCGASFGIHIAKMLDLPSCIIEVATKVLDEFAWGDVIITHKTDDNISAEEPMECDDGDADNKNKNRSVAEVVQRDSSSTSSAASFVAEIERIMRSGDQLSNSMTTEQKAAALRQLMTTMSERVPLFTTQ